VAEGAPLYTLQHVKYAEEHMAMKLKQPPLQMILEQFRAARVYEATSRPRNEIDLAQKVGSQSNATPIRFYCAIQCGKEYARRLP
jgi:hypothetical protein